MLAGLRGIVQPVLRALARAEVGAIQAGYRIKEWFEGRIYEEVYTDYEKFARQDFITGEIARRDQDQLIAGDLHESSTWSLGKKYRYEVLTPWETMEGTLIETYTTISTDQRLSPNEVFEAAVDHPSMYVPEGGVFRGPMEIAGSWYRET